MCHSRGQNPPGMHVSLGDPATAQPPEPPLSWRRAARSDSHAMASGVIVLDGGVAGLLACAAAVDTVRWTALAAPCDPNAPLRERAVQRQTEFYGLPLK